MVFGCQWLKGMQREERMNEMRGVLLGLRHFKFAVAVNASRGNAQYTFGHLYTEAEARSGWRLRNHQHEKGG